MSPRVRRDVFGGEQDHILRGALDVLLEFETHTGRPEGATKSIDKDRLVLRSRLNVVTAR